MIASRMPTSFDHQASFSASRRSRRLTSAWRCSATSVWVSFSHRSFFARASQSLSSGASTAGGPEVFEIHQRRLRLASPQVFDAAFEQASGQRRVGRRKPGMRPDQHVAEAFRPQVGFRSLLEIPIDRLLPAADHGHGIHGPQVDAGFGALVDLPEHAVAVGAFEQFLQRLNLVAALRLVVRGVPRRALLAYAHVREDVEDPDDRQVRETQPQLEISDRPELLVEPELVAARLTRKERRREGRHDRALHQAEQIELRRIPRVDQLPGRHRSCRRRRR